MLMSMKKEAESVAKKEFSQLSRVTNCRGVVNIEGFEIVMPHGYPDIIARKAPVFQDPGRWRRNSSPPEGGRTLIDWQRLVPAD